MEFRTKKEMMDNSKKLIPYRRGNLWGYCDYKNEIFIDPKYNYVTEFQNGFAFVRTFRYVDLGGESSYTGNNGIINESGQEVLPLDFCSMGKLNQNGGTYAFKEVKGYSPNHPTEDEFFIDHEMFAVEIYEFLINNFKHKISLHENQIFILETETRRTISKYSDFVRLDENTLLARLRGDFRETNTEFEIVNLVGDLLDIHHLKEKYNRYVSHKVYNTCNPEFQIKINGKYGYINPEGEVGIPFIYDNISQFIKGIAIVKLESRFSLVDEKGVILFHFIWDSLEYDKIIEAWIGTIKMKLFYIDPKSRKYFLYHIFSKRLYSETPFVNVFSKESRTYGILDYFGKEIFPVVLSQKPKLYLFYSIVKFNNKYGLIDKNGIFQIPNKYKQLEKFDDKDIFVYSDGHSVGIINLNFEKVIEFELPKIKLDNFLSDAYFQFKVNKGLGLIGIYLIVSDNDNFLGYYNEKGQKYWEGKSILVSGYDEEYGSLLTLKWESVFDN